VLWRRRQTHTFTNFRNDKCVVFHAKLSKITGFRDLHSYKELLDEFFETVVFSRRPLQSGSITLSVKLLRMSSLKTL
jgi:hypothetical protein